MCLQWSKCFRFTLNKSTIFALYLKRVWLPLHIFCVSTIRSLQNAALLQWFLFSVRCSLFPYGTKWFFLLFNRKPHYRLCRTKWKWNEWYRFVELWKLFASRKIHFNANVWDKIRAFNEKCMMRCTICVQFVSLFMPVMQVREDRRVRALHNKNWNKQRIVTAIKC